MKKQIYFPCDFFVRFTNHAAITFSHDQISPNLKILSPYHCTLPGIRLDGSKVAANTFCQIARKLTYLN